MRTLLPIALSLLLFIFSGQSFAAVKTWDGGGADANWLTAANWAGDVAPVAGDDLVFPAASAQFTTNNNFAALTSFNSLTIDGGNYTIGGSFFRLAAGLTVNGGTQTFNTSVNLSAAQTFTAAAGSTTTITLLNLGSNALMLDGGGSFGMGAIAGSGGLTKAGAGASLVALSAAYSGAFNIVNGILIIDAQVPGSVTVNGALAAVGGTGTVGVTTITSGAISAGTLTSPTGIFKTGNLSFAATGNFVPKIGGTTPGSTGHDQLSVTGTVFLNNARLAPLPWNGFRPAIGDSFVVLKNDGADAINGIFLNAPEGAVFGGPLNAAFRISYQGGDGNDIAITRVNRAPDDFDGDGKSDVSVFHPPDGTWQVQKSSGGTTSTPFGLSTDKIAPGDYDSDNKTDYAVFRPANGVWYVLRSSDSTVAIAQFGANGDLPVAQDYDGDGRADYAVFRPSTGVWYSIGSFTTQISAMQFGLSTDKPMVGDFDGDGQGDLAVYRPSDGTWHIFRSSDNGYYGYPFGIATDRPCPADIDGDGKSDTVIFRGTDDPNLPDFYIIRSSDNGFQGISWGIAGDVPVVADYDGDGKADVGIFRPSTNAWYWLQSSNGGVGATVFGNGGSDIPVAAAFVP